MADTGTQGDAKPSSNVHMRGHQQITQNNPEPMSPTECNACISYYPNDVKIVRRD